MVLLIATPHIVFVSKEKTSAIHAIITTTTTTNNKESYNYMSGPVVCGDVCKEVVSGRWDGVHV